MIEPAILVIGEALVDIVHRADGCTDETPGGSPANVALALARLGRASRLLTQLGDDVHGQWIRHWLEGSGVELTVADSTRTATATARLDQSGSAQYSFDMEWRLGVDVARPVTLSRGLHPAVVHTGSIATFLAPGADVVCRLLDGFRRTSLITYDPNVRPALLEDRADARSRAEAFVTVADLVKASDEDLAWLYPGADPLDSARRWLSQGPSVVVVTRGAEGAVAVAAAGAVQVQGRPVRVVDTVGAGDTFMSALIHGLIEQGLAGAGSRERLRDIAAESLRRLLILGAHAAAITVSRPGADPPHRSELTEL
ncbi:carbohydrate kinase family protein [Microbacterium suwonense]|uniref:Fructokinase n=1 Tax=Microbacterium suwonense TaxID=683047 RepID=A0ABN6X0F0_9MICO|nr:carbohydrate kinase [Microbacterium suwonense]BDZ37533.1 fructokinase [Microbacterium suwonense]